MDHPNKNQTRDDEGLVHPPVRGVRQLRMFCAAVCARFLKA